MKTRDLSWIVLPDHPETKTTIHGKLIAFATIEHDQDVENPCTDRDGFGMIRSLSNRHINCIRSAEEFDALVKDNPEAVALSYFEHGNCLWGVKGTMGNMPDFQWDGVGLAGLWIPDKCILDSSPFPPDTPERKAWMEKQAASACEVYTEWANGECYAYSVSVYRLRKHNGNILDDEDDYRHDEAVYEDSCCGYIGWENVVSALRETMGQSEACRTPA